MYNAVLHSQTCRLIGSVCSISRSLCIIFIRRQRRVSTLWAMDPPPRALYAWKELHLQPGRVAQSVGHLTRKSRVLGSIPGLATYFRFSFRFFKKGSCSYSQKYVHEILDNRLGDLSRPRKSVVRLAGRPDMTLDVYRGRKTTIQQQQQNFTSSGSRSRDCLSSSRETLIKSR